MNSAGLIVISLFAGGLLVVIILALAALIFLHIQLKREVTAATSGFAATAKEITDSINGARTSFGGIRQDVKTALLNHENQVADVLARHQKAFEETIGKVNGVALEAACRHVIVASKQIATVAQNLQTLLYPAVEPGEAAPPLVPPIGPEDFAPADTIYTGQTTTAKMDTLADAVDALEHFSANAPSV